MCERAASTSRTSRREAIAAAAHVVVTVHVWPLGTTVVAKDHAAEPDAHSQPQESCSAAHAAPAVVAVPQPSKLLAAGAFVARIVRLPLRITALHKSTRTRNVAEVLVPGRKLKL